MIYEVSGHYVISSGHMWLPGCYETAQAAHYAFQFPDETLRDLQESVNPGGIITMAMLKSHRQGRRDTAPSIYDSVEMADQVPVT